MVYNKPSPASDIPWSSRIPHPNFSDIFLQIYQPISLHPSPAQFLLLRDVLRHDSITRKEALCLFACLCLFVRINLCQISSNCSLSSRHCCLGAAMVPSCGFGLSASGKHIFVSVRRPHSQNVSLKSLPSRVCNLECTIQAWRVDTLSKVWIAKRTNKYVVQDPYTRKSSDIRSRRERMPLCDLLYSTSEFHLMVIVNSTFKPVCSVTLHSVFGVKYKAVSAV